MVMQLHDNLEIEFGDKGEAAKSDQKKKKNKKRSRHQPINLLGTAQIVVSGASKEETHCFSESCQSCHVRWNTKVGNLPPESSFDCSIDTDPTTDEDEPRLAGV